MQSQTDLPTKCPICGLEMEPYRAAPEMGLLACYFCDLTWNPYTKKARAIRRG